MGSGRRRPNGQPFRDAWPRPEPPSPPVLSSPEAITARERVPETPSGFELASSLVQSSALEGVWKVYLTSDTVVTFRDSTSRPNAEETKWVQTAFGPDAEVDRRVFGVVVNGFPLRLSQNQELAASIAIQRLRHRLDYSSVESRTAPQRRPPSSSVSTVSTQPNEYAT
ncbi:hypothetical protein E4U32_007128 [Claviceps aff. humidiphila group G2b]|nr:hypothetical protein E4U32_007128 [Claviceps aff. humidiphila group G2b]